MNARDWNRAEDASLRPPEPRPERESSSDDWHDDPRNWPEQERTAAIGARSALMKDAAWAEVAADVPGVAFHPSGYGVHFAADPVGEYLRDNLSRHPAQQALIVRLMVRAMATGDDQEHEALLQRAMACARELAKSAANSRAWDMAEAAIRREREAA